MATTPLSGTNIRLLSGIRFQSDYKHTMWFDSLAAQQSYFNSKPLVHSVIQADFQRIEGFNFIKINSHIDDLWNADYIMFQNASYNNRWFYGFITKLEYKQANMTYVHFEIDVLQTWMFDISFHPSFVVREHCKLWNDDGTPVINTVPEDLNYGSEYVVAKADQYRPYDDLYFMVVITKKAVHTGGGVTAGTFVSSLNGYPQPYCTYICPFKMDGSCPDSNIPLPPLVGTMVDAMYNADTTVNNIVSMYITDVLPDFPTYSSGTITFDTTKYAPASVGAVNFVYVSDMMNYQEFLYDAGSKYDGYTSVTESKLLMHPYTLTELVDFKGNKVTLKNEYVAGTNLMISVRGSLGTSNKVVYEAKDYRTSPIADSSIRSMVAMENALINDNPNDVPVLTDNLAAFLQGNRNSYQNQKNGLIMNTAFDGMAVGVNMVTTVATGGLTAGSLIGSGKGLGNDINAMQGMTAKYNDIKNVPPSMAKQGSNTNFDYGNGYNGLWIIKKEIYGEYRTKLTDFFNAYGYKVNDIKIPNLHTRAAWNYVQTKSANITGDINNNDIKEIKSIFDGGITLWHVDDIGNYTLSNGVL